MDVFFRELVHRNKKDDKGLGYLVFLQGGGLAGWLAGGSRRCLAVAACWRGVAAVEESVAVRQQQQR